MCVAVTLEPGVTLTQEEVLRMQRANSDGTGFAWAEDGVVQWYKSVTATPEYIFNMVNTKKDTFRLLHFRLSTVGGVRADLCHPFEIGPMANAAPVGYAPRVMIHNGHWHRWTDVFQILQKESILPDLGPWSDSRLAALLASDNLEWLDTVGGRVAVMDGDGNTAWWGSWENLRPGIKVSNNIWATHSYNYRRSGRDRDWAGWGWTKEEWKEKEKHDAEKERQKAKGEKGQGQGEGKDGGAGSGSKGQKAGEVRVGVGPGDQGDKTGRASSKRQDGGRDQGTAGQGTGEEHGEITLFKGQQEIDGVIYDFTPWQNPSNKKWYVIDPRSVGTGTPRTLCITEASAHELLGKAAPTPAKGGNGRGA